LQFIQAIECYHAPCHVRRLLNGGVTSRPTLNSLLIYVASAAKLGRTTEEYRRILREDHITIRGAQ
jgi:hypothetical protein